MKQYRIISQDGVSNYKIYTPQYSYFGIFWCNFDSYIGDRHFSSFEEAKNFITSWQKDSRKVEWVQ